MEQTDYQFSSNAIRLSLREWVWAVLICVIASGLAPVAWLAMEKYEPGTDYRLPYGSSDDYWMFERWCEYSSAKYPFLVLGDSVMWGQYVKPGQTLAHFLNAETGEEDFANLGVDGIHPMAMAGLVKYYGKNIRRKAVLLHLNPLWMSSEKRDMQTAEEFRFNHPRLVPQVYPNLACYNPTLPEIVGIVAERHIPLFTWKQHMKAVYFENMAIQDWTMQHPYKNPLSMVEMEIPAPENEPKSMPVSWKKRGISEQDFAWIRPEESLQWAATKEVLEVLRARRNRVFVMVGPINPYLLTQTSRQRYELIRKEIQTWLDENGIPHLALQDLPSQEYADTSHPLKDGYRRIAQELFENNDFKKWLAEANEN